VLSKKNKKLKSKKQAKKPRKIAWFFLLIDRKEKSRNSRVIW